MKAIFHDFRRTAATNLLAGGMSPANVRAIVEHLSEEMTAKYNKPAMATLAAQQAGGRIARGHETGRTSRKRNSQFIHSGAPKRGFHGKDKPVDCV